MMDFTSWKCEMVLSPTNFLLFFGIIPRVISFFRKNKIHFDSLFIKTIMILLEFGHKFGDVVMGDLRWNFNFQTQPSLAQSPQINVYIFLYIPNATIMADAISRHFCLFYDCFFCLFYLFCFNFVTSILFQFYHLNFVPISPSQFCSNFANSQKYTIQ